MNTIFRGRPEAEPTNDEKELIRSSVELSSASYCTLTTHNSDAVQVLLRQYPAIGVDAHHEWRWSAVSSSQNNVGSMLLAESKRYGYPPYGKRRVFLAVRGSVNLDDWRTNMQVAPTIDANGLYHTGFSDRARLAPLQYLLHQLQMNEEVEYVVMTGHSLGGAIAMKITLDLLNHPQVQRSELCERIRCITFGAPLLANATVARTVEDLYHKQFISVVRTDDIVPKLLSNLHEMILNAGNLLFAAAMGSSVNELNSDLSTAFTLLRVVYNDVLRSGQSHSLSDGLTAHGLMGNLSKKRRISWMQQVVNEVRYVPFGRFYELPDGGRLLVAVRPQKLVELMAFPSSDRLTVANYFHHQLGQYLDRIQFQSTRRINAPVPNLSPALSEATVTSMVISYLGLVGEDRMRFEITGTNLAAFNNVVLNFDLLPSEPLSETEARNASFENLEIRFERRIPLGQDRLARGEIENIMCTLQGVFGHAEHSIPSTWIHYAPEIEQPSETEQQLSEIKQSWEESYELHALSESRALVHSGSNRLSGCEIN